MNLHETDQKMSVNSLQELRNLSENMTILLVQRVETAAGKATGCSICSHTAATVHLCHTGTILLLLQSCGVYCFQDSVCQRCGRSFTIMDTRTVLFCFASGNWYIFLKGMKNLCWDHLHIWRGFWYILSQSAKSRENYSFPVMVSELELSWYKFTHIKEKKTSRLKSLWCLQPSAPCLSLADNLR